MVTQDPIRDCLSRTVLQIQSAVVKARILLCYSDIGRKQGKPLPGELDPGFARRLGFQYREASDFSYPRSRLL
jgi:hypothetical protein